MIFLIDNYDSFTYNLVHLIGGLTAAITIVRNDEMTTQEIVDAAPQGVILSPGPCGPAEAGICVPLARDCADHDIPLLGVCLGHQSIGAAHGAQIERAGILMHGKTSEISHNHSGLFGAIPSPFTATRYHSLIVSTRGMPSAIVPLAQAADDGELMALHIEGTRSFGVQFHPESIASEYGSRLVRNFLKIAGCDLADG